MKSPEAERLPQDIEALLAAERIVLQVPEDARHRAMARARGAVKRSDRRCS